MGYSKTFLFLKRIWVIHLQRLPGITKINWGSYSNLYLLVNISGSRFPPFLHDLLKRCELFCCSFAVSGVVQK